MCRQASATAEIEITPEMIGAGFERLLVSTRAEVCFEEYKDSVEAILAAFQANQESGSIPSLQPVFSSAKNTANSVCTQKTVVAHLEVEDQGV